MFLPNQRLNRRHSAYSLQFCERSLAFGQACSKLRRAADRQANISTAAFHFRTPSPCGQLAFFFRKLPTFSLYANDLIWRGFADLSTGCELPCRRKSRMAFCEAKATNEGPQKCVSKHGSSPQPHWQDCRHAGKKYRSRRFTVQGRAQPQPLCWMAKSLPARSSVRRATCSTARQTRANVTRFAVAAPWSWQLKPATQVLLTRRFEEQSAFFDVVSVSNIKKETSSCVLVQQSCLPHLPPYWLLAGRPRHNGPYLVEQPAQAQPPYWGQTLSRARRWAQPGTSSTATPTPANAPDALAARACTGRCEAVNSDLTPRPAIPSSGPRAFFMPDHAAVPKGRSTRKTTKGMPKCSRRS